jgi:hypothetical protein
MHLISSVARSTCPDRFSAARVEEIHKSPAELLGIVFEWGIREEREQIGPDGHERL